MTQPGFVQLANAIWSSRTLTNSSAPRGQGKQGVDDCGVALSPGAHSMLDHWKHSSVASTHPLIPHGCAEGDLQPRQVAAEQELTDIRAGRRRGRGRGAGGRGRLRLACAIQAVLATVAAAIAADTL